MPIEAFSLTVALAGVATLVAGIALLMRANSVARRFEKPDNDMVSDPEVPRPRRSTGRATRLFGWVFTIGSVVALSIFWLVAAGVIDSDWTRTDPTVQRP